MLAAPIVRAGCRDHAPGRRRGRGSLGLREGFPPETYARVAAFANFAMHVARVWQDAEVRDGRVVIATARGPFAADFVICATGIEHDFGCRPELAGFADNVATWTDRYTPPADEADERLGRFPYLAPDYAFVEREAGRTPWISDVHLFGIGTTMSFGPAGSSINAKTTAVPRLVAGITRGLFRTDLAAHWQALQSYDNAQVTIDPRRIAAD